ncbi:DUF3995 domain-containing protein [Labrenzia sp. VG12]|uniref:DUF3995 domain-containing protein n=1 Tax=Labrenzia sp. VG12 TaxID=2021862 RepID=UPI000B8BB570|nr:DUF3995 domain-containing protein [Labrenzia sp. VG12]ASP36168.1 hypothetical protein CHH27_25350 [Labrenzia sp. VG12]
MSEVIAVALFAVLFCVAAVHAYWALGGLWPARDEATLAQTVVGVKDLRKMPGTALTLVVSALIALAGVLPLYLTGLLEFPIPIPLSTSVLRVLSPIALGGLAFIFLARGMLSYTGYFQKMEAEEPFVTLDRRYYAPFASHWALDLPGLHWGEKLVRQQSIGTG